MKVKVLEQQNNGKTLPRNFLKISILGEEINHIVLNTLRRIIISLVPSYAFDSRDITIEKNTSVDNNDKMRNRLSNLPIVKSVHKNDKDIKDILKIESDALAMNVEARKEFLELELEKETRKAELLKNLNIYIEAKNTTTDIMNVDTSDKFAKYYIDGKKISNIYSYPVAIVQLHPGEEFKCNMVASRNIHTMNNIYCPCSLVSYNIDNNEFYLESYGQIPEKDILIMACNIFIIKLDNLVEKLNSKIKEDIKEVEITIERENHTMGNILTRYIQDHNDVVFCGFKVETPLEQSITIRVQTNQKSVIQVIGDVADKLNKMFKSLISEFEKI